MSHRFQLPAAPRIAIFRALQLGDMLCAVPALRAIRAAYPDAHVTLVGLPWAAAFVTRYEMLLDELIVFPGGIGFPEQAETDAHLPAFHRAMQARHFDMAVQLHGSGGVANDIVTEFGADQCVGYTQPGESRTSGVFIPWPDSASGIPEVALWANLIRAAGIDVSDTSLEFPLTLSDWVEAEQLTARHDIDSARLVIVHAGAQLPSRRWPASRFAAAADALSDVGWQVALTGVASEAALVGDLASRMRHDPVNLCGATSLGGLAALVAAARLVVCNDTGMSHIAVAMRRPSVVVASGSDTRRWSPQDYSRHVVLADHPSCRPCAFRDCPYGHPCAMNISVESVVRQARHQLERWERERPAVPCTGLHARLQAALHLS